MLIKDFYENLYPTDKVRVVKHGANGELIGMGRALGYREVEINLQKSEYLDELQIYVNINGDIFPSCDLSYEFMDKYKGTVIWLGNVQTHTFEQYTERLNALYDEAQKHKGKIYLSEEYCNIVDDVFI
jgi:hypothetical protein